MNIFSFVWRNEPWPLKRRRFLNPARENREMNTEQIGRAALLLRVAYGSIGRCERSETRFAATR
jgi:hypothetical protein